jgi:hypothetical protein
LVSKELKGEEETRPRRFSGGSEGGMTTLRFGSSRVEEGGSRQRTARRRGRRGSVADGSRRWEPMERRKWAEWRNGPKPIWAAWKIEKLLEFVFSSFEFASKVKIEIKYIFFNSNKFKYFQKIEIWNFWIKIVLKLNLKFKSSGF